LGIDLRVANPAVTVNGETLPHPIRPSCPKGKPDHPDRQGSGLPSILFATRTASSQGNSNSKGAHSAKRSYQRTPTSDPRKKPGSPPTSIIGSPRPSSPRLNAPGPESPESNSTASATCTVPQAPRRRCTLGVSTSSGRPSTTRLNELACLWLPTPPPTPPIAARGVGTSTGRIVAPETTSYSPGAPRRCRPERSHQHRHARSDGWAASHAATGPDV